jgi:hypothetical protein
MNSLSLDVLVYRILSSIVCTFCIENEAELFPAHYTWKVADKGIKMAIMMMINSCEIILENFKKSIFSKNHCEIWVRTILACTLHSIK